MTIHLIRSSELDPHQFTAIYDLIRQYPGPVQYAILEKSVEYSIDELETEIWEEEELGRKKIPMLNMVGEMIAEPSIALCYK